MLRLSTFDANDFVQAVTLDGKVYRLAWHWNDTEAFWSLGVRSDKDVAIVEGVRVVPNWPLLAQYRRPALPPGDLIVICDGEVGRNDILSGRAVVYYTPEAEHAAL